jgi:hypothetical protein
VLFDELKDLITSESAHSVPATSESYIWEERLGSGAVILDPAHIDTEHLSDFVGVEQTVWVLFGAWRYQLKLRAASTRG